jgi:hypothetical protein
MPQAGGVARDAVQRDRILAFFDFADSVFDVVADGSPVASSRDIVRSQFRKDRYIFSAILCNLVFFEDPTDQRDCAGTLAVRAAAQLHEGSRITADDALGIHRTGSVTAAGLSRYGVPLAFAHHARTWASGVTPAACHGIKLLQ